MECVVVMARRHSPSAAQRAAHALLAAQSNPAPACRHSEDAMNDACRDMGSKRGPILLYHRPVAGPHPYPAMVRDFQSIIGEGKPRAADYRA